MNAADVIVASPLTEIALAALNVFQAVALAYIASRSRRVRSSDDDRQVDEL